VLISERVRAKSTGIVVDNDYVQVITMKDGKAEQIIIFEDTAPIFAAHGLK
jgi:ketosteroid isomerase-like protein